MITTRYTACEGAVVEFVTELSDGDIALTVNVLPIAPPPPLPPSEESSPETTLAAAPVPPLTKKARTLKGVIRAMWTAVFSFGGEALVYGLNNLTSLNLPPGVGLAIGAAGYGLKAAAFPNSKL